MSQSVTHPRFDFTYTKHRELWSALQAQVAAMALMRAVSCAGPLARALASIDCSTAGLLAFPKQVQECTFFLANLKKVRNTKRFTN